MAYLTEKMKKSFCMRFDDLNVLYIYVYIYINVHSFLKSSMNSFSLAVDLLHVSEITYSGDRKRKFNLHIRN